MANGWKLRMPKTQDIGPQALRETIEKAYASGVKGKRYAVDTQMEALIRKEIGEFDKDNPKYAYLKDEEASFEHYANTKGNPSFNQTVPQNFQEMRELMEKVGKEGRGEEENSRPNENFEEEEEDYEKTVDSETMRYIKEMKTEPMEHATEENVEGYRSSEKQSLMDRYGIDEINYKSEIFNKVKYNKDYKGGRKEATHEHNSWQDAYKDSEFWNN